MKEIISYDGTPFQVSDIDYDELSEFSWSISKGYVKRNYKEGEEAYLARFIMKNILKLEISGYLVDHINRNKLDNQRENLRIVTISENNRNKEFKNSGSSKFAGVSKSDNKWKSSISIDNNKYYAFYDTELECAHQYNLWLDEFKLHTGIRNQIDIPLNFVPWKKTDKKINLPKNITILKSGEFRVRIEYNNIIIHNSIHNELNEAELAKEEVLFIELVVARKLYHHHIGI
jgi:hypothetical protein